MERLDAVLIEQILRKLSTSALSAAERTCRHWADLIAQRQLWRSHATQGCGFSATAQQTTEAADEIDWREICLHRTAAKKWREGKLLLSATLQGHAAAVTCIAALSMVLATGAADSTARIWDMNCGRQLHLLQHAEPVVAVALPSPSTCVTATASAAVLWQEGKPVRRFRVLPGGVATCLALTDTRLLLGSTAGAVQYFDLFSGSQQLITRHGSSVTILLTQQQDFPQHQLQDHVEDWEVVVGTQDGQVSCLAVGTGNILWQLPNKYPSRVVTMSVQQYQQCSDHVAQPHTSTGGRCQYRQEQQRLLQKQRKCLLQCSGAVVQLLFVLNARSQLICWRVPGSSNVHSKSGSMQFQLPACYHCVNKLLKCAGGTSGSAAAKQPTPAATAAVAAARLSSRHQSVSVTSSNNHGSICSSSVSNALAVLELPVPTMRTLSTILQPKPLTGCTTMVCPAYGNNCLLTGSSDGSLYVVELLHGLCGSSTTDMNSSGSSNGGGARSNSTDHAGAATAAPENQQQQQQHHEAIVAVQSGQPEQHRLQQAAAGAAGGGSSSSDSRAYDLQLQLVRRYALAPLAKALARRCAAGGGGQAAGMATGILARGRANPAANKAAATAAAMKVSIDRAACHVLIGGPHRTSNTSLEHVGIARTSNSVDMCGDIQGDIRQLPDVAHVTCAVFMEPGKLAVGLASGHVCVLKFALRPEQ